MQNQIGWLCYFDAYGFSSEVAKNDNPTLISKLEAIHRSIRSFASKHDGVSVFFLSDSFILFFPCNPTEKTVTLTTVVSDCVRIAQTEGAKKALFFRGAIFFGEMAIKEDAIVGIPLLLAARMEARLAHPIIVILRDQLTIDDLPRQPPRIVRLKDGIIEAWTLFPRPIGDFLTAARRAYANSLNKGPANVALVWKDFLEWIESERVETGDD